MSEAPDSGPASGRGYETRDVSVRGVVITAAIVAGALIAALLLTWWVKELSEPVPGADRPLLPAAPPVPGPRLQVAPPQDLESFMAEKLEHLDSYGWISRDAGIGHIPIDQAMERVARDGIPRWSPPERDDPATVAHRARQRALEAPEEAEP